MLWKHLGYEYAFLLSGYCRLPEDQKHLFMLLGFRGNSFMTFTGIMLRD